MTYELTCPSEESQRRKIRKGADGSDARLRRAPTTVVRPSYVT